MATKMATEMATEMQIRASDAAETREMMRRVIATVEREAKMRAMAAKAAFLRRKVDEEVEARRRAERARNARETRRVEECGAVLERLRVRMDACGREGLRRCVVRGREVAMAKGVLEALRRRNAATEASLNEMRRLKKEAEETARVVERTERLRLIRRVCAARCIQRAFRAWCANGRKRVKRKKTKKTKLKTKPKTRVAPKKNLGGGSEKRRKNPTNKS